MVLEKNVHRHPITSYFKALDPSCAVKVQLSQAQRKVDEMSDHVSLTSEASGMSMSFHMIFSL